MRRGHRGLYAPSRQHNTVQPSLQEDYEVQQQQGLNMNSPNIWPDVIQSVVDTFRNKLQQWATIFCPICCRIFPFYRKKITIQCSHCQQARNGKVSKYSADNDMDPGPVLSSIYNTDIRFHQN